MSEKEEEDEDEAQGRRLEEWCAYAFLTKGLTPLVFACLHQSLLP